MIAAVVLAAGLGRRMGRIKPLLDIDGSACLAHVIRHIREAGVRKIVVVLGCQAAAIRHTVDLSSCQVVVNEAPERGLSSSLALGLRALPDTARGALIFHADMPFVAPATIRAIVAAAVPSASLVAPQHNGVRGFPVFLGRACFPELLSGLQGDAGARAYIDAHRANLVRVDVNDSGCVVDLDRPEDLTRAHQEASCSTSG